MSGSAFDRSDRAKEGIDHLQAAALEAIGAARAFLDLAEELVREPGAIGDMARALTAMVGAIREEAAPAPDVDPEPRTEPAPARPESGSKVRRIPLS